MSATKMAGSMSPGLVTVMERARDPEHVFLSLAHHIDEAALRRAHRCLRKDAAVGTDGITVEQYGENLESNVRDLHARLKTMRWRHQPIRRVHIPKGPGKTRPIGISCTEDKIVQGALREILELVLEPIFLDCSYGFRPGRNQHGALRELNRTLDSGQANWILELDVESFFDSIDRKKLSEMIQERVLDGSIKRLVGKCLHVGVLEGEKYSEPEDGTAQGSVLSPLLGNLYLHHVLDSWFERDVRPRMRGRTSLIRYADDGVIAFEHEDDAVRVLDVLRKRFERYGLKLHPEKTRIVPFQRPEHGQGSGKGPGTFDFLGFTHFWARTKKGRWRPSMKTRSERLRRTIASIAAWCMSHRHQAVKAQHATLCRKIRGHFAYFGVNGNSRCLRQLVHEVERVWRNALRRRSQRTTLTWERFREGLLKSFPLPTPYIRVSIWAAPP